jgi:hypothetical protein
MHGNAALSLNGWQRMVLRVVAAGQALDRATPEGRLQTGVLAEFAEYEREKIKVRSKAGIHGHAHGKRKPWGTPVLGYRKTPTGDWEPDPAEVPVVERIFRERVENGLSYNGIARLFIRDGVPARRGGHWGAVTIRKILTGKYVLGYFSHGGEWIEGRHRAIIDRTTWEAAQALAAQGAEVRTEPWRSPRRVAPVHRRRAALRRVRRGDARALRYRHLPVPHERGPQGRRQLPDASPAARRCGSRGPRDVRTDVPRPRCHPHARCR